MRVKSLLVGSGCCFLITGGLNIIMSLIQNLPDFQCVVYLSLFPNMKYWLRAGTGNWDLKLVDEWRRDLGGQPGSLTCMQLSTWTLPRVTTACPIQVGYSV